MHEYILHAQMRLRKKDPRKESPSRDGRVGPGSTSHEAAGLGIPSEVRYRCADWGGVVTGGIRASGITGSEDFIPSQWRTRNSWPSHHHGLGEHELGPTS
jgi:hypothetical protein